MYKAQKSVLSLHLLIIRSICTYFFCGFCTLHIFDETRTHAHTHTPTHIQTHERTHSHALVGLSIVPRETFPPWFSFTLTLQCVDFVCLIFLCWGFPILMKWRITLAQQQLYNKQTNKLKIGNCTMENSDNECQTSKQRQTHSQTNYRINQILNDHF